MRWTQVARLVGGRWTVAAYGPKSLRVGLSWRSNRLTVVRRQDYGYLNPLSLWADRF